MDLVKNGNFRKFALAKTKPDEENLIVVKSKAFALRIIRLYKHVTEEHREYILSKQLLRCGTSIGANVKEAVRGQSKSDFGAKMNIALKEASESEYLAGIARGFGLYHASRI